MRDSTLHSRSPVRSTIAVAALSLACPAVYAASIGPCNYAIGRGWLPDSTGRSFYGPLRALAANCRAFDDVLWEYSFAWWVSGKRCAEGGG